jgi:hypothetical protein
VEHGSETIIVSEVSRKNAHLLDLARAKGFTVQALRNNYTISHLLVRAFLRLTDEGAFFVVTPADAYVSDLHDYIFSRPATSTAAIRKPNIAQEMVAS